MCFPGLNDVVRIINLQILNPVPTGQLSKSTGPEFSLFCSSQGESIFCKLLSVNDSSFYLRHQ
jgi:hypothetical protein